MEPSIFVPNVSAEASRDHFRWLLEVTGLPTASGREHFVIAWIKAWAAERSDRLVIESDASGNLVVRCKDEPADGTLTYIDAHIDHPGFVVVEIPSDPETTKGGPGTLIAEFRGSVAPEYFVEGTPLRVYRTGHNPGVPGSAIAFKLGVKLQVPDGAFPRYELVPFSTTGSDDEVQATAPIQVGDIARWELGTPWIDQQGLLHTYATDNLACVVAALATLDELSKRAQAGERVARIRVLLSRAEEIGFVGAFAAIRNGTVPTGARVVVLENSKALRSVLLGRGVVVRLGDRISTVFSPSITSALAARASQLSGRSALGEQDKPGLLTDGLAWQSDLMPGGVCHATLFQQFGYEVGCLVLPLNGYHNMGENNHPTFEVISTSDFWDLVRLLISIGIVFPTSPDVRERLDQLFDAGKHVLS